LEHDTPDQAAVDRIVYAIRKARTQTPSAVDATGFCASLAIDIEGFDERSVFWLKESLIGTIQGNTFVMSYLNVEFRPVIFASEEEAKIGARSLMEHLDRKFLFGLYRLARKKYQMPPAEVQPVKFLS